MAAAAFHLVFRSLMLPLAICAVSHGAAPARALDQIRIHAFYHDGEFDKVIRSLEAFRKSGRACSHAESLFVEKHLAVVYAANPGTRELGRYHMFRILDLAPNSDLLDMFVGEEVSGVFEKVGKEYALRNAVKPNTAHANPSKPVSAPAASNPAVTARPPAPQPFVSARPYPSESRSGATRHVSASPSAPARPVDAARIAVRAAGKSASVSANASSSGIASASAGSAIARPAVGSLPDSTARATGASSAAWKEPGLWIGGGAALAVVAFTFFYSGSETAAPQSKTYVVPATASR